MTTPLPSPPSQQPPSNNNHQLMMTNTTTTTTTTSSLKRKAKELDIELAYIDLNDKDEEHELFVAFGIHEKGNLSIKTKLRKLIRYEQQLLLEKQQQKQRQRQSPRQWNNTVTTAIEEEMKEIGHLLEDNDENEHEDENDKEETTDHAVAATAAVAASAGLSASSHQGQDAPFATTTTSNKNQNDDHDDNNNKKNSNNYCHPTTTANHTTTLFTQHHVQTLQEHILQTQKSCGPKNRTKVIRTLFNSGEYQKLRLCQPQQYVTHGEISLGTYSSKGKTSTHPGYRKKYTKTCVFCGKDTATFQCVTCGVVLHFKPPRQGESSSTDDGNGTGTGVPANSSGMGDVPAGTDTDTPAGIIAGSASCWYRWHNQPTIEYIDSYLKQKKNEKKKKENEVNNIKKD